MATSTDKNYRIDFRKETEELARKFLGDRYDDYMTYRYNPKDYIAICIESPAYKSAGVRLSIYSDGQANEIRLDRIRGQMDPKVNLLPPDLAELSCKYWQDDDVRIAQKCVIRELNRIRSVQSESH